MYVPGPLLVHCVPLVCTGTSLCTLCTSGMYRDLSSFSIYQFCMNEDLVAHFEEVLTPFGEMVAHFKEVLAHFREMVAHFEEVLAHFGEV